MLCGAADGSSTRDEPWEVTCQACFDVAWAESLDDPFKPHPFKYPEHCAACQGDDLYRALRRDPKPNGTL
jgi:hypothetical protein